jgi:glutamate carboxypeptidase
MQKWSVRVTGKEAHAGTDHQSGASACHELAIKVAKLHALTDYKKGITVNVGAISGGSGKFNIVCGSAEAKLEMRFKTPEAMEAGVREAKKILDSAYVRTAEGSEPTRTEYKSEGTVMPFAMSRVSRPHIKRYRELLSKLENADRKSIHINGLADISRMVHPKMVAIDDLGPVGGHAHTREEYMEVRSLETRSEALATFLAEILAKRAQ